MGDDEVVVRRGQQTTANDNKRQLTSSGFGTVHGDCPPEGEATSHR